MTTRWDHSAFVGELEPALDVIEAFRGWSEGQGDAAGAALARDALGPLRSLLVEVEARRRQDDREEAEEEAVVSAALKASETVDEFVSAAVARELARRRDALPA